MRPGTPDNDYAQPGTLFRKVFCDQMRKNTISNLSGAMKGVRRDIAERVIKMFHKADGELGEKLGQELGFPVVKSRL